MKIHFNLIILFLSSYSLLAQKEIENFDFKETKNIIESQEESSTKVPVNELDKSQYSLILKGNQYFKFVTKEIFNKLTLEEQTAIRKKPRYIVE